MRRGEIWWAQLDDPTVPAPGYRRPVLILQSDWALASRLRTVTVIPLTSNIDVAEAPGNVLLEPRRSGLRKPSVVVVSQIITLDREQLLERLTRLTPSLIRTIEEGVRMFLEL